MKKESIALVSLFAVSLFVGAALLWNADTRYQHRKEEFHIAQYADLVVQSNSLNEAKQAYDEGDSLARRSGFTELYEQEVGHLLAVRFTAEMMTRIIAVRKLIGGDSPVCRDQESRISVFQELDTIDAALAEGGKAYGGIPEKSVVSIRNYSTLTRIACLNS